MLVRMQREKLDHLHIAGRNVNGTATLEKSLAVSYKTKHNYHKTQQWHSWVLIPEKNENLCSHKNLYSNVYSSFICNSPKLETTLGINKPWYIPTMEY